jgi:talin
MFYKAACYLMLFSQVRKPKSKLDSFSQVMVTNVTSLLKTVKAVEDEHCRGTRALEATIEAIGQEIRVSNHIYQPKKFKLKFSRCSGSAVKRTAQDQGQP